MGWLWTDEEVEMVDEVMAALAAGGLTMGEGQQQVVEEEEQGMGFEVVGGYGCWPESHITCNAESGRYSFLDETFNQVGRTFGTLEEAKMALLRYAKDVIEEDEEMMTIEEFMDRVMEIVEAFDEVEGGQA